MTRVKVLKQPNNTPELINGFDPPDPRRLTHRVIGDHIVPIDPEEEALEKGTGGD